MPDARIMHHVSTLPGTSALWDAPAIPQHERPTGDGLNMFVVAIDFRACGLYAYDHADDRDVVHRFLNLVLMRCGRRPQVWWPVPPDGRKRKGTGWR